MSVTEHDVRFGVSSEAGKRTRRHLLEPFSPIDFLSFCRRCLRRQAKKLTAPSLQVKPSQFAEAFASLAM
jgi:hypothetical protein